MEANLVMKGKQIEDEHRSSISDHCYIKNDSSTEPDHINGNSTSTTLTKDIQYPNSVNQTQMALVIPPNETNASLIDGSPSSHPIAEQNRFNLFNTKRADGYYVYSNSPPTMATMARLAQSPRRGKVAIPGSKRFIYDNTSHEYGWLLPGWIVEERVMASGRLYKYFYDPAGNMYRTKEEVLHTWDKLGLVVLD